MNVGGQSMNHRDFLFPIKWAVLQSCLWGCTYGIKTKLKYRLFCFQYILSVDRANLNKELLTGKNINSLREMVFQLSNDAPSLQVNTSKWDS